jgi:hypothetical protein
MPDGALKKRFEELLNEATPDKQATDEQLMSAHILATLFCKALVSLDQDLPDRNPYSLVSEYINDMLQDRARRKDGNNE